MKKSARYLIIILCFLVVFFTVFYGIAPAKYEIREGDTAPVDIYATREVVDTITTEKQRQVAAENVTEQYVLDNDVTLRADRELGNIFLKIAEARENGADIKYQYALNLGEQEFKNFRERVTSVHQEIMNQGVSDIEEALVKAKEKFASRNIGSTEINAGIEILKETIVVNKQENAEKTQEAVNAAKASVPEVVYKENQVIVRRGDIVNAAQLKVLSDLGLIKGDQVISFLQIIGAVFFTCICFVSIYLYVISGGKNEKYPSTYPVLISVIVAATILLTYINKSSFINAYVIPLAAGAILLGILIDVKVAMFVHTVICASASVIMGGNMFYLTSVLLSGYICIYLFSNISQRSKLVVASCKCAGVGLAVFLFLGLLQGLDFKNALKLGASGVVNAVVSSIIVMGVLPFLETFFDVITPFRLLELSNPNNPLLSKLLKEAPGTYHHSLMVGNLAEAGCEAVGGNSLLARVGAYYHDAGKLMHPEMFTENQYGDNPHDFLAPEESAKIIIAHAKDGADILKQYKLPKAIRQIAQSHHGTTYTNYFLFKAEKNGEVVKKDEFRYTGPIPKTKEEAIIMFADSTEAAVRSLDDKSEENIRKMINKIIDSKMEEGQLKKCPLTFEEVWKIGDAFIKVFGGYFHSRIKYPEKKGESSDKGDNQQSE